MDKISKITNIFLNKYNFALVYIALLTLRSVFFLQKYVDIGCKVCLFWGIAIILADLWKYKMKFFKVNKSYTVFILCVLFALSVLANFKYSLYGGVKNLLYCVVFFFVLFRIGEDHKDVLMRYIKRNNDIFIIINMCIAIASLSTFLFNIKFVYIVDHNFYKIGFWYNRLNGVCNSNMETMFGFIAVVMCIINWFLYGKNVGKRKILYIGNMILQYIYYVLSSSRAATVCYIIAIVMICAFIVYPWVKERYNAKKAIGVVAIVLLLFAFSELYLVDGVRFTMKQSAIAVETVKNSLSNNNVVQGTEDGDGDVEDTENMDCEEENTEDILDIEFDRVENFENDVTNNRAGMWLAALKIVKEYPIFGVADADSFDVNGELKSNLQHIDFDEADMLSLKRADFYFHNGFVQILLCGGVVFALAFVVFMIQMVIKYLKYIFCTQKNTHTYILVVLILSIIAAIVVDNMVEVHMLFSGQDGIASILWYLLGSGLCLMNKSSN